MSLIDYLVFKQQKTMWVWDTQKKQFIDKEVYEKSSYAIDVSSETYSPPSPIPKHLEFT